MMATRALQAMKVEGAPLYDSNLSSVTGIAVGADLLDKPLAKTQVLLLLLLLLWVVDIESPFLLMITIPTATKLNFKNIHLTSHPLNTFTSKTITLPPILGRRPSAPTPAHHHQHHHRQASAARPSPHSKRMPTIAPHAP
jgi:hypothetical protein